MSFPKSLIIGLGGIGSEIVSKVYQRFILSGPTQIEKEMVGFLCFDTDANDIETRRKIMPKEYVVQISAATNITVATYLDRIKAKSSVEEWFDTDQKILLETTLNDGAGQIRMASRLAMSLAIEENKFNIIQNVINRILAVQADKSEGNDIRVHIVSTLAGGTGAGSFLQVSYLVKEILRSKGLDKPRLTGYFLLADVLCQDPSTQFDEQKRENTLANTYASIKELNGIYNYEKTTDGFNLDFEYRFFTDEEHMHTLPDFEPFEVSYLYDFEDSNGENRGKKENYFDQIEDYLYLNVLSPVGAKTRSAAINDILGTIKTRGVNRYASTGVSKIIFPIEDIMKLFSVKRVADNLKTSWLKIDQAYLALLADYKHKTNQGMILEKPSLDKIFMDQVEYLSSNGSGVEKIVFRKIYQSTQFFDKNGNPAGAKAHHFLRELLAYLVKAKETKKSISDQNERLLLPAEFLQHHDHEQDRNIIQRNEVVINFLQKEVMGFIDNTKSLGIEEGILADFNELAYLSNTPSRINTYILKKDEVLHPLAVRYFLYDLRRLLKAKLISLKDENSGLKENIDNYALSFDIKDDQEKDNHIETAAEAYEIFARKDKKITKKLAKVFGSSGSLEEFKEKYSKRTKSQMTMLNQYAVSKLQEEVLSGLLHQVNIFVDEIENLFNNLSDVHSSLVRESEGLAKMHENLSRKSTQYVLGSKLLKEKIYDEKISLEDDIEFPADLSQLVYNALYQRVCLKANKRKAVSGFEQSIAKVFTEDVIKKQTEDLTVKLKEDVAGYNVIKAIRYEAELLGIDESGSLKRYFSEAVKLANPLGAKNISKAPHINSWGLNPGCLEMGVISESEADEIMGAVGDNTNGAYRIVSEFFSKFEIIRENSRFLLSVPENYPQFSSGNKTNVYSISPLGEYYKAYKLRIEAVQNGISVSPHLDKRWHFPGYFPNIGESRNVAAEKIYRAFFWGLVNRDLVVLEESGEKQWAFLRSSSNTTRKLVDQHQKNLKFNIYDLIFKGLYANPGIVDSIIERTFKRLEESRSHFSESLAKDKVAAMLNTPVLKDISGFRFTAIRLLKDFPILQVLEKISLKDKETIIKVIGEAIADSCIYIGGNNLNSRKTARKLLLTLLGSEKSDRGVSVAILENILRSKFDSES